MATPQWHYTCRCGHRLTAPCHRTLSARMRQHNMKHPMKKRVGASGGAWEFTCGCGTLVAGETKQKLDQAVKEHLRACQGASKKKSPARGAR